MAKFNMVFASQEYIVKLFSADASIGRAIATIADITGDLTKTTTLQGAGAMEFCDALERILPFEGYNEADVARVDAWIEDTLLASGVTWSDERDKLTGLAPQEIIDMHEALKWRPLKEAKVGDIGYVDGCLADIRFPSDKVAHPAREEYMLLNIKSPHLVKVTLLGFEPLEFKGARVISATRFYKCAPPPPPEKD
jgi:hypothetical protein